LGRNEAYDVMAAAEVLKKHPETKDLPLYVYGFSMGAVSAITAQAQDHTLFKGMILDCPFESSDNLFDRGMSNVKVNVFGYKVSLPGTSYLKDYMYSSPRVQELVKRTLKALTRWDSVQVDTDLRPVYPEEAIKFITVPVFMIGSHNDDKAPEAVVKKLYTQIGSATLEQQNIPKRLWISEGRRHFDTVLYNYDKYCYKVNSFLNKCLDGTMSGAKEVKEGIQK